MSYCDRKTPLRTGRLETSLLSGQRPISARSARAFSLVELVVVLAVAIMLTGMLLPAMSELREGAHRIVCSSNLRQLGQGLFMYAHDHGDNLPTSFALDGTQKHPQELMRAFNPETEWDGWGVLFHDRYCGAVECYYCPSHLGDHPIERYYDEWFHPTGETIYTNYHYSGDRDWKTNRPRYLHRGNEQALATDGLRTSRDFNHVTGMNVLYGDGAVRWSEGADDIFQLLPEGTITDAEEAVRYQELWSLVEYRNRE